MSILVFGSINTDLVVRGDQLPQPGETVIGGEFSQFHGGKGANQAVAAARLSSTRPTFVACLGSDDLGQVSLRHLQHEGIQTDHIRVIDEAPSGVALILVDRHAENMISVASGANSHLRPRDVDALPAEVFAQNRVCLVSLEIPLDTAFRAIQRARESGLQTILNPAPATTELRTLPLSHIDLITPNKGELEVLTATTLRSDEDDRQIIAAARRVIAQGCRQVVVTLGARGAIWVTEDQSEHVPAFEVKAVDTTGAGDAFNGALAVMLAENQTGTSAVRWSNLVAAMSAEQGGAQTSLPTRTQVREREEKNP